LSSFLAGQLTPADEAMIEQHVDGCPHCQRHLAELTEDSAKAPMLAHVDDLVEEPLTPRLRRNMAAAYSAELSTFYSTASEDPTTPESRRAAEEWPRVPGYEVTGLLGRGGIGVVYRATDQRLKRPVALKIIRQQATPDERERLQREAEALATLRHPGVVQIYEIGEHQGRPFIALEFVGGGSLSRHMAGKAQPARAAARVVATLAETMHRAHQHGLVHRDLKPANVLLHWENESRLHDDLNYCRPKVTDFGLVKNMSVDSGLTHSRDLLGTPSYMAPEQAGGDPETVGPACDIWALGAILYELLTGKPPFHGATAVDTLMQVRQTEPVPPSRLLPKLPRELETICLKCLEKIPSQRYASALELAEDLHRFRDGQTIQARPVSPVGRAWRWCRRNPAVSALTGVAAVLLVALAIGGPVTAYREAALRREAIQRTEQAEAEKVRAGQNLDLATLALEETLKQVYERIGVRPDTLRDFDQNAWEATIPYLEQLVSQEANTPDLQLRKARATRQLARSLADRKERDRAAPLFQQAISELATLAAAEPKRADLQRDLGLSHLEYGTSLLANKETATEGEAQWRLAAQHLEVSVAADPQAARHREDLANALNLLGERLMKNHTSHAEAHDLLTRAASLRQALSAEFPGKRAYLASEVFTLLSLGMLQSEMTDNMKSGETFEQARTIARKLSVDSPGDPQFLHLQAMAQDGLTIVNFKAKKLDDAKAHAQEATGIHDRLAAAFPAEAHYSNAAMTGHLRYWQILVQQRDWSAAAEQSKAALAILKLYTEAHPNEQPPKINAMTITRHLGEMLQKMGRKDQAAEQFRAAIAIGDGITDGGTVVDETISRSLAESCVNLGELLTQGNDAAAALAQFERAIDLLSPADDVPANRDGRRLLKRALMQQAKAFTAVGRANDASKAEARAKSLIDAE
jgi:eukaryotic-like serine/threonine-protein kinase